MAGHWYSKTGEPVFFVKQKGDPNKTRKTSIMDATELGLLPSVTTIKSDILKAEGLLNWMVANRDRAHLQLRFTDVPDEVYIEEVNKEADRIGAEARDRGSFIHKVIEAFIAHKSPEAVEKSVRADESVKFQNDTFKLYYDLFSHFYTFNGFKALHVEHVIVDEQSFVAGRCDWIGESDKYPAPILFADWKTQKFKEGRANFYPEFAVQLAAYAKGFGREDAALLSVCIDTSDLTEAEISAGVLSPNRIATHSWPEGVVYWFKFFTAMALLWRSPLGKDFDRRIEKQRAKHAVSREAASLEEIKAAVEKRSAKKTVVFPKTRFPSAGRGIQK